MFLFTTPDNSQRTPSDPPHAAALRQASRRTGVSFGFLANTAQRESGFRATAQAGTSSARGLFQFVEQTWLRMVRSEGARLGLGEAAAAIRTTASGRAVADPADRRAILALRDDPALSAEMAAALARDNGAALAGALGRPATDGELYIAHFLGASAAARLIRMAAETPETPAADAFPAAARANRSVFHARGGEARSAVAVYRRLTSGFEATPAAAAAASQPEDGALFHRLFGARAQAKVAPSVARFWGRPDGAGRPVELNLFRTIRS